MRQTCCSTRFIRGLIRAGAIGLLLAAVASAHGEAIEPGRVFDADRANRLFLTLGQVSSIEGSVDETTRRLFTVTGQDTKQDNAESYSFEELGLDGSDMTFGISYEHMWKFVTLRVDGAYVRAEAGGQAPRDLYIGVDGVNYRGQSLDYMVIPRGTTYQAEIESMVLGLRGQVTPFTINSGGALQIVPWLHFGLFSWAGSFDVDAGETSGVIQYENPPRNYAVGGDGSGTTAVFAPEIGFGGELKLRLAGPPEAGLNLLLQGNYAIFEYDGTTDDLAISSRNNKDVTIDYTTYELRALLEIPFTEGMDLMLGLEYKNVSAEGDVQAQDISLEETLARREKFDKAIAFEMDMVNFLFGVRF